MWRLTEDEAAALGLVPPDWRNSESGTPSSRRQRRAVASGHRMPKGIPYGEALLAQHIAAEGLPQPDTQFRFDQVRKWRADFAWQRERLIAEVDGGTHGFGSHNSSKGYRADRERDQAATLAGWTVLRFTVAQVKSGEAISAIARWFAQRAG